MSQCVCVCLAQICLKLNQPSPELFNVDMSHTMFLYIYDLKSKHLFNHVSSFYYCGVQQQHVPEI